MLNATRCYRFNSYGTIFRIQKLSHFALCTENDCQLCNHQEQQKGAMLFLLCWICQLNLHLPCRRNERTAFCLIDATETS